MVSNRARKRREMRCKEVNAIGELLLDAIRLQRYFKREYSRRPEEELLRQWKTCRKVVAGLVQDYAIAVARYRRVAKASLPTRRRG
jgi:hypothetical protein